MKRIGIASLFQIERSRSSGRSFGTTNTPPLMGNYYASLEELRIAA